MKIMSTKNEEIETMVSQLSDKELFELSNAVVIEVAIRVQKMFKESLN